MSFGFGVGDFIAAGELCWKLYRNFYMVSREAPEEITCLRNELSQLKTTIDMLVQEVKDPNSLIARCGQDRVKHANGIMSEVKSTLEKLEKLVGKYEYFIGQVSGAKKNIIKRKWKKNITKRKWDKVKYASEIRTINDLRAKLSSHHGHIGILLLSTHNSSLARIEEANQELSKFVEEVRTFIGRQAVGSRAMSSGSVFHDEVMKLFLDQVESSGRPRYSTGILDWIQAGKWWLMKAQSGFRSTATHKPGYAQAYTDLLKACWILTDVIMTHPQQRFLDNGRQRLVIEHLAKAITGELERQESLHSRPNLRVIQHCDLRIWTTVATTSLEPVLGQATQDDVLPWKTAEGELVYQRFGAYVPSRTSREGLIECIIFVEINLNQGVSLCGQNFEGKTVFSCQFPLSVTVAQCKVDKIVAYHVAVEPVDVTDSDSSSGTEFVLDTFNDAYLLALLIVGFHSYQRCFAHADIDPWALHATALLDHLWARLRIATQQPGYRPRSTSDSSNGPQDDLANVLLHRNMDGVSQWQDDKTSPSRDFWLLAKRIAQKPERLGSFAPLVDAFPEPGVSALIAWFSVTVNDCIPTLQSFCADFFDVLPVLILRDEPEFSEEIFRALGRADIPIIHGVNTNHEGEHCLDHGFAEHIDKPGRWITQVTNNNHAIATIAKSAHLRAIDCCGFPSSAYTPHTNEGFGLLQLARAVRRGNHAAIEYISNKPDILEHPETHPRNWNMLLCPCADVFWESVASQNQAGLKASLDIGRKHRDWELTVSLILPAVFIENIDLVEQVIDCVVYGGHQPTDSWTSMFPAGKIDAHGLIKLALKLSLKPGFIGYLASARPGDDAKDSIADLLNCLLQIKDVEEARIDFREACSGLRKDCVRELERRKPQMDMDARSVLFLGGLLGLRFDAQDFSDTPEAVCFPACYWRVSGGWNDEVPLPAPLESPGAWIKWKEKTVGVLSEQLNKAWHRILLWQMQKPDILDKLEHVKRRVEDEGRRQRFHGTRQYSRAPQGISLRGTDFAS